MSVFNKQQSDEIQPESQPITPSRTHRREPGILGELNSGLTRVSKSIANSIDQSTQILEHTITGAGYSAKTYRVESAQDYAMTRHNAKQELLELGYSDAEISTLFGQL